MMENIVVLGPSATDKGGMTTVINNISNSFLKKSYNFIHIPTYTSSSKLSRNYLFFKAIMKTLFLITFKGKKYQLFHIHVASKGSFYRKYILLCLLKLFHKKTIVHIHGAGSKEFYDSMNTGKKLKMRSDFFRKTDYVVVLSQSWKNYFVNFVNESKIIVLRNNVKIVQREAVKHKDNTINFLFLGRFGERKGIYDLLKVIHDLHTSGALNDNVKFYIGGDGEIEKVNNMISKYQLNNLVQNKGWINAENKIKYLNMCDVYILPSYNEGLPMSILEAMSYGMPIISTNVGGIPETVHNNQNGYLINPGDLKSLQESILSFIKDPEIITKMGNESYRIVSENFNEDIELKKLNDIYHELLN